MANINWEYNDKELLKELGAHIRQLRKDKGYTLEDLSAHSSIDTSDISKIERGEINVAFTTLAKLAKGLEKSLSELVKF